MFLFTAFLTHISSVLITFVTLAVFVHIESKVAGDDNENVALTASRVFAALALFNQMTVPLFIFPITVPIIITAIVSTRRLMTFLDQPEVQREYEGIRNMARILSRSDASLDAYEKEDSCTSNNDMSCNKFSLLESDEISCSSVNEATTSTPIGAPVVVVDGINPEQNTATSTPMVKTASTRVKLRKNNHLSQSTKLERNRMRHKSSSKEFQIELPTNVVASIRNGLFTWQKGDNANSLKIDKLDIPRGT